MIDHYNMLHKISKDDFLLKFYNMRKVEIALRIKFRDFLKTYKAIFILEGNFSLERRLVENTLYNSLGSNVCAEIIINESFKPRTSGDMPYSSVYHSGMYFGQYGKLETLDLRKGEEWVLNNFNKGVFIRLTLYDNCIFLENNSFYDQFKSQGNLNNYFIYEVEHLEKIFNDLLMEEM